MMAQTVDRLETVPQETRSGLVGRTADRERHDAVMASLPAMNTLETGGAASAEEPLAFPLRAAAWNLERCLFVEHSAVHLLKQDPHIVLLSEMDDGMARTGQRHTTADLARQLGMSYAYGVEFLELGLGSETEREFCRDAVNEKGFHGNALLSRGKLAHPFLIRLWGERLWRSDADQPRIGERIAVGAVIATEEGPVVAVSTHLESATTAAYRERQMVGLFDALDRSFGDVPVMIGGDLNTGNHAGGDFEAEGLFRRAAERGFERHGGRMDAMSTRPSLITRWPERAMKLDWFLTRGLVVSGSELVPSLDETGRPLSDHDLLCIELAGLS